MVGVIETGKEAGRQDTVLVSKEGDGRGLRSMGIREQPNSSFDRIVWLDR